MTPLGKLLRFMLPVVGMFALFAAGTPSARAGSLIQNTCNGCQSSQAAVAIDPASYKVWPSGSRTFVNAQWSAQSGSASFTLRNTGILPSQPFSATAEVSDHNPLTQTPVDDATYSYPIPALAPGSSFEVRIPLDPTQCDIFVTVNIGDGQPTVLRTGDPAAC